MYVAKIAVEGFSSHDCRLGESNDSYMCFKFDTEKGYEEWVYAFYNQQQNPGQKQAGKEQED